MKNRYGHDVFIWFESWKGDTPGSTVVPQVLSLFNLSSCFQVKTHKIESQSVFTIWTNLSDLTMSLFEASNCELLTVLRTFGRRCQVRTGELKLLLKKHLKCTEAVEIMHFVLCSTLYPEGYFYTAAGCSSCFWSFEALHTMVKQLQWKHTGAFGLHWIPS